MSAFGLAVPVALNLLFNAFGSFLLAAALASIAAGALGVRRGGARQLFLALPLAKLLWDLARGVPADSFFWLKLAGARQDLGTFQVGFGVVHGVFPVVTLSLGAMKDGHLYPQSAAELFATLLTRKLGPAAPALLVSVLVGVAAVLFARRVARACRAVVEGEALHRTGEVIGERSVQGHPVAVVLASDYDGVPFAGGVVRRFVCFSRRVHEALGRAEREAVVLHELGHLARRDLYAFACLGVVEDAFWFVPGLRARCRAIRAEAEVCADAWAVRAGASPDALASALVRVAEVARGAVSPALGLTRSSPTLRRIRLLLDARDTPARSRTRIAIRTALALVAAGGIFASTGFGNK
jgi:beta-lactamase regulating signal transducer with metallopeptidase domain